MNVFGSVVGFVLGLGLLVVALMAYFAPTIIANKRNHHAAGSILFVNLILGWTLVFWVVCLIWANSGGPNAAAPTAATASSAPTPSQAPGAFCSSCGARTTGGTFCSSCGARLA